MNNKKKPPKRYETANQIRDEIDASKERVRHKLAVARALDLEADILFKHRENSELGTFKREQAKKIRHQAYRIENHRLPKLAQKLAEFNTELLPGVIPDNDRSVPRRLKG